MKDIHFVILNNIRNFNNSENDKFFLRVYKNFITIYQSKIKIPFLKKKM